MMVDHHIIRFSFVRGVEKNYKCLCSSAEDERPASNRKVAGLSPARGTNYERGYL